MFGGVCSNVGDYVHRKCFKHPILCDPVLALYFLVPWEPPFPQVDLQWVAL